MVEVYPELPSGLVEPGTDDAKCIVCGVQAMLYALDTDERQWFTCLDHHGLLLAKLIRGEVHGSPPLPPLS